MSALKSDLPIPSLAFETLSLASPRPAGVKLVLSGDEKAKSLMGRLSESGILEASSHVLGSQSKAAPKDASLYSEQLRRPILDSRLPVLLKCTGILCSTHNQELAPPLKQSKEHEAQTALRLCLDSFKGLRKYLPDEDEHFQKTLHYRAIVNTLFSELRFLQTMVKLLSVMIQSQYMQDFFVENLGMTWSPPSGQYVFPTPVEKLNFEDLESYGFYLRFYKPLKATKDFDEMRKVLLSQREIFTQYKTAPSAGVLVLILSLLKDLSAIPTEQCATLLSDLAGKLHVMNHSFQKPYGPHLVSVVSPNYGYLLCEIVQQLGNTLTSIDQRNIEPLDKKIWSRPKACLVGMLDGYLDKQIQIYSQAFGNMQKLVAAKPLYKTTVNFEHYNDASNIAIYTPEQFKSHIVELQESIRSSLANCLPISEPIKNEEKKEKKDDAHRVVQVSSASGDKKKAKSKKKKPQTRKAFLDGDKERASTPSPIATAKAASQKGSCEFSVAALSPVAFLSEPRRHFPHQRVRRWFSIDVRALSKIRDFEDTIGGKVVYKYRELPEEELKLQLLLHGAAPLVDRILNVPHMRKKYCFSTKSGLGIFVEVRSLEAVGRAIKGVLFYGINGAIYFHRKIDLLTMERIQQLSLSQLVEESAQTVLQTLSKDPSREELAEIEKELESDFKGDTVTVDKYEVLHFKDDKQKCQVSVIPLS